MAALGPPSRPLPPLRSADVFTVAANERIWRIYRQGGGHPAAWHDFRHVGPLGIMRFDHHLPPRRRQVRGVLYGAIRRPRGQGRPAVEACVAEAFFDTRTIDTNDRDPWIVAFTATGSLRLLDLTGAWPTRARADQSLNTGKRSVSRQWSQAIYDDYPHLDGIHYRPAHYGPGHSVVLFERAVDRMPPHPRFHRPLSDPGLRGVLQLIGDLLGYAYT